MEQCNFVVASSSIVCGGSPGKLKGISLGNSFNGAHEVLVGNRSNRNKENDVEFLAAGSVHFLLRSPE